MNSQPWPSHSCFTDCFSFHALIPCTNRAPEPDHLKGLSRRYYFVYRNGSSYLGITEKSLSSPVICSAAFLMCITEKILPSPVTCSAAYLMKQQLSTKLLSSPDDLFGHDQIGADEAFEQLLLWQKSVAPLDSRTLNIILKKIVDGSCNKSLMHVLLYLWTHDRELVLGTKSRAQASSSLSAEVSMVRYHAEEFLKSCQWTCTVRMIEDLYLLSCYWVVLVMEKKEDERERMGENRYREYVL